MRVAGGPRWKRAMRLGSPSDRSARRQRPIRALGNGFDGTVTGVAIVVLSLGLIRVHPLLAIGLNVVAVGGLAPTLWGWRQKPVLRWLVLGAGVGVTGAWLALVAMAL